jgi:CheY-like chemotaxis protein
MSRILVVDDEPDVRTAIAMLLEEEGHSVIQFMTVKM